VSKSNVSSAEKNRQALGPQPTRIELDPIRRDAGYRLMSEAIKALTIVNGGAAVAALAFLGQVSQRLPLTSVVIRNALVMVGIFALGTILPPAGALAFAYNTHDPRRIWRRLGRAAILGSIVAFIVGLYFGWRVLEPLGYYNLEIKQ
jgi:hypothetical protein